MLEGCCHCGTCDWRFDGDPGSVTACNCTLCRRYGVLWIYGHENETATVRGPVARYRRADRDSPVIEVLFCPTCAAVLAWRGLGLENGRRRMAVNVRLASPDAVAALPVDHLDGLDSMEDLPGDGRCVRDLWF